MPKTNRMSVPLARNKEVADLLALLQKHKSPSLTDFRMLLNKVNEVEQQLEAAVQELAAIRAALAEAEQRRHPAANAMRKAVISMQVHILELREKLAALRQAVIEGSKNALASFREKGASALDNIARFFKVRPILEAIHTQAGHAVAAADRSVVRIEAASMKYHEAGRHLKNAGRALTGKEAVQEAKAPGMVSKTFTAPFRAVRACFRSAEKSRAALSGRLKQLEDKKQSVKAAIRQHNEERAKEKTVSSPKRSRAEAER